MAIMKVKVSDLRKLIREEVENLTEETTRVPPIVDQYAQLQDYLYDWSRDLRFAIELYEQFESQKHKYFRMIYSVESGDPDQGGVKPQETTQGRQDIMETVGKLNKLLDAMQGTAEKISMISRVHDRFKEGLKANLEEIVKESEAQQRASRPAEPELTPAQKRAAMWKGPPRR